MNTTTPALPSESAIAYIADTSATFSGSVVTLKKTGVPATGPGVGPPCQDTILMPCLSASSTLDMFCARSKPASMIPSGLRAIAWLMAEETPATVPWPSITRVVQPRALAASAAPLATPVWPPLRRSPATMTTFLPGMPGRAGGRAVPVARLLGRGLHRGLGLGEEGVGAGLRARRRRAPAALVINEAR